MKKIFTAALVAFALLTGTVHAQTATSISVKEQYNNTLRALISLLVKQVQILQAQLAQLQLQQNTYDSKLTNILTTQATSTMTTTPDPKPTLAATSTPVDVVQEEPTSTIGWWMGREGTGYALSNASNTPETYEGFPLKANVAQCNGDRLCNQLLIQLQAKLFSFANSQYTSLYSQIYARVQSITIYPVVDQASQTVKTGITLTPGFATLISGDTASPYYTSNYEQYVQSAKSGGLE